jgi:hypothetical protein
MRRDRRLRIVLRLTAALFALVGQSAIASISASSDEAGAAAHVERSGIALHHAHNEATCVVCRVLSIQGRAAAQPVAQAVIVAAHTAPQSLLSRRPGRLTLPDNPSRAPPENA